MNSKAQILPMPNPALTQMATLLGNTVTRLDSQSLIGITSSICNCIAQRKESVERTRRFEAFVGLQVEAINARTHTADQLMQHAFDERGRLIDTYRALLSQAIQSNNTEQILLAINAMNALVTQSPLASLSQISQIYDGTVAHP